MNAKLFDKPVFLEMKGSKPEAMAEFFNALVETGIKAISIEDRLSKVIETISSKKATWLSQEKKKRENEIARLAAELGFARSMGIEENNFKSIPSDNGTPKWYLYGAKILEEELRIMKSRDKNSDDIKTVNITSVIRIESLNYNTELEGFDKQLRQWESFKIVMNQNAVVIVQPAIPFAQPIPSKKGVITIAGLLAGLIFGSLFAFFQEGMKNLRER